MAGHRFLRGATATLAAIECALGLGLGAFVLSGSSDPLGVSIAEGVAKLTAIPLVLCALPALILAWLDRLLPVALALALLAPAAWLFLMAHA